MSRSGRSGALARGRAPCGRSPGSWLALESPKERRWVEPPGAVLPGPLVQGRPQFEVESGIVGHPIDAISEAVDRRLQFLCAAGRFRCLQIPPAGHSPGFGFRRGGTPTPRHPLEGRPRTLAGLEGLAIECFRVLPIPLRTRSRLGEMGLGREQEGIRALTTGKPLTCQSIAFQHDVEAPSSFASMTRVSQTQPQGTLLVLADQIGIP